MGCRSIALAYLLISRYISRIRSKDIFVCLWPLPFANLEFQVRVLDELAISNGNEDLVHEDPLERMIEGIIMEPKNKTIQIISIFLLNDHIRST